MFIAFKTLSYSPNKSSPFKHVTYNSAIQKYVFRDTMNDMTLWGRYELFYNLTKIPIHPAKTNKGFYYNMVEVIIF